MQHIEKKIIVLQIYSYLKPHTQKNENAKLHQTQIITKTIKFFIAVFEKFLLNSQC